jgi:hypothetical protein
MSSTPHALVVLGVELLLLLRWINKMQWVTLLDPRQHLGHQWEVSYACKLDIMRPDLCMLLQTTSPKRFTRQQTTLNCLHPLPV